MQKSTEMSFPACNVDRGLNSTMPTVPRRMALDRAGLRAFGIRKANSTLLKWEKAGIFPRRYRIGGCVFWDEEAVREHLARLAAEAR